MAPSTGYWACWRRYSADSCPAPPAAGSARSSNCGVSSTPPLDGVPGWTFLGADTDGQDGNAPNAGAFCDSTSWARARAAGLDPDAMLATNDAHSLFEALGDALITGPTGTNVNDFRALALV